MSQEKKIDKEFLDLLVCPQTGKELIYNQKKNILITKDGKISYKIYNGIPRLIVD